MLAVSFVSVANTQASVFIPLSPGGEFGIDPALVPNYTEAYQWEAFAPFATDHVTFSTYDAEFAPTSSLMGSATADAIASSTFMGTSVSYYGDADPFHQSQSLLVQWFTVDQDTEVLHEWNLRNDVFDYVSELTSYSGDLNFTTVSAAPINNIHGAPVFGSHKVVLKAGVAYAYRSQSSHLFAPHGEYFGRITVVPAPTSAALLGFAGLTAARRCR